MEQQWQFGRYLDSLLEKRNWSRNRLAKEVRLSSGYITWLINGFSSDKANPPSPSIDVFIKLSKALNVPITSLIAAYQGKDPDSDKDSGRQEAVASLTEALLKAVPPESLFAAMKAQYSPKEWEEIKKEVFDGNA